ncbi:LPD7 domain-containing protein [Pseudomonas lutea]|uniref:LPD7 domain-containing protein n=1 Tax=Pseudomonas lutea TaxID=243924 RepID=UPI000AD513A3|nr:LPD7 domain-containing protein [Pseudomonas lutea]
MIIRYGGGNKGIKEYLEEGRKVDRHLSRDELDRRVPVEGDLMVTQAVIDSIPDQNQDRYLHISMSFNEPDVQEDDIKKVFGEYRQLLMAAYGDDEYNIYAEIHWPKVKQSYNHKTQAMEPRYPHVHIVIPKKNVLTGKFLNPVGMHEVSVKYLDAIQEKLNRDNGLSSPRLSPRIGADHYAAALDRYKATEFVTKNGKVKRAIHSAIISRDIRSFEVFKDLVSEYGEVKVRNAGKENEYLAVRVGDDKKFTNLKANIFNQAYLENRALVLDPVSDAQVKTRLETWQTIQSREVKYISNASAKVKSHYRDLSLPDRRTYLDERERSYGEKYRPQRQPESHEYSNEIPGLGTGDYGSGHFEFGREGPAQAGHLHELSEGNVDHFAAKGSGSVGLFLLGDEADDVHDVEADQDIRLRGALYAGGGGSRESRAGRVVPDLISDPQSCVLTSLLHAEADRQLQANDLDRFKEIRTHLDAQHLLAYAQLKFGVDPALHPVSKAKDGSVRIRAGKYNYNVSDFLTRHVGLEWGEASNLLLELYEKQQSGITEKPLSKVILLEEWRRFRQEIYPQNIRTYDDLKNEIKVSFSLGLKAINSEYFSRRKNITQDQTLSRADKHYFRSVVILEKLQKVEALQQRIDEQNSLKNRVKYPYSTLFYDFATKSEALGMKILDQLKRKHVAPMEEGVNTIGGQRPFTPHQLPDGAEAMKRARLVAKLHAQEREARELRIKLSDLRARPQADGTVAFNHREHGKQIFVNHPDRVELNRTTEPDEVGVGLMYATERFGNPLEISGSKEFKQQLIEVAAERDMDITFTDERLNQALAAKRLELGLEPLAGNVITVPTLELDSSLPVDQAVDKALLESRVAELDAVNQGIPYSMADVAMHQDMVSDATARHEEIAAGFLDSDRIREIAREDLDAYAYLQGKPEQVPLALAMAETKGNGVYSDYLNEHGPAEFGLTVDAARFMVQRDGGISTQQPVAGQVPEPQVESMPVQAQVEQEPVTRFIRPDFVTALEEKAQLEQPAVNREPTQFADWTDAASTAARLHADFDLEPRSDEYSRNVAAVGIEASQYMASAQGGQEEFYGADKAYHEAALVSDMSRLAATHEAYRTYVQNYAPTQLQTRMDAVQPAPAVEQPAAGIEPLNFTHNGQPAELDLSRYSGQPAPGEPAVTVIEQPAASAPEPLNFTHNGQPAELDLSRYQGQPDPAEPATAVIEQPAASAPEPLSFTHNGRPAELDLSRYQGQPVPAEPAAAVIEQPAASAPEPLNFTHNGQPATLDLGRNSAPASPVQQLSPEVAARASELRQVREMYAADAAPDVYDQIVRSGTLADVERGHEDIATHEAFGNDEALRELARKDLVAFERLEGKPEQQNVALAMGRAMENEQYSAYIAEYAPEGFAVTVEASRVVASEQMTQAPSGMERAEPDFDM